MRGGEPDALDADMLAAMGAERAGFAIAPGGDVYDEVDAGTSGDVHGTCASPGRGGAQSLEDAAHAVGGASFGDPA